ncbi:MAG: alpha/beta hydrolase [Anaerolineales bacterium]|jgi:pimeloyl-ACP methyl ester carboxylesterase
MELQEQVLDARGCKTRYWVGGNPAAGLVVFTHGASLNHHEWDATLPIVAERYRVLAWDVRGHGLSRPASFTIADAVADLLGILDNLRVGQATLVGHSMGGNLHQELVFHHPERVAAMVCVDCTWNFQKPSSVEAFALKAARPMLKMYPYSLLVNQSLAATATARASQDRLRLAVTLLSKDEFIEVTMATTQCLHYEPGYRINKPLLLIVGEKDATGNIRKSMPLWSQEEPKSRLVVVPNARHAPNLDAPEFFHKELMGFLEETAREASNA